jgi:hypothetical protein
LRHSTEKDRPQAGGNIFVNGLIPVRPKQAQAVEDYDNCAAFVADRDGCAVYAGYALCSERPMIQT